MRESKDDRTGSRLVWFLPLVTMVFIGLVPNFGACGGGAKEPVAESTPDAGKEPIFDKSLEKEPMEKAPGETTEKAPEEIPKEIPDEIPDEIPEDGGPEEKVCKSNNDCEANEKCENGECVPATPPSQWDQATWDKSNWGN